MKKSVSRKSVDFPPTLNIDEPKMLGKPTILNCQSYNFKLPLTTRLAVLEFCRVEKHCIIGISSNLLRKIVSLNFIEF
jgi:hypothetical protein